jgi:Glycosyl hydrolase family 10
VVNEAFCTDGSGSWTQSLLGEGYVSEAFAAARQADPSCKLLYNDCTVASAGYAKVSCCLSCKVHQVISVYVLSQSIIGNINAQKE